MTTNPDIESDIPHEVFLFLKDLNRATDQEDLELLHHLYEVQFDVLTQNFYYSPNQFHSWPSPSLKQMAASFHNTMAEQLYSFLYYKHLFTDRGVRLVDAKASWNLFCEIFKSLAAGEWELPSWMLWDIFDEFIFQMTVVYQKRYAGRSEWSVAQALAQLDHVMQSSNVAATLKETAEDIVKEGYTRALSGFFATITKAKLSVLLGDYYGALAELEPLDIYENGRPTLMSVGPAHVSLMYYVGMSYLMLRRYADAGRIFRQALSVKVVSRKFTEKIQMDAAYMHILACTLGGIQPDHLSWLLYIKKAPSFDDDRELLASGDEERFCEVFDRCSPKFLSVPPIAESHYKGTEGKEQQARMFRRIVQQQQDIIKLRGYFGVYQVTTTDLIEKILQVDDGRTPLFAMKVRTRQLMHDGSSANLLSGTFGCRVALDFSVSGPNVAVVPKSTYKSTELKYLNRLNNLRRKYRYGSQRS